MKNTFGNMQCFVVWVGDTAGAARVAQIVGTMESCSEEMERQRGYQRKGG